MAGDGNKPNKYRALVNDTLEKRLDDFKKSLTEAKGKQCDDETAAVTDEAALNVDVLSNASTFSPELSEIRLDMRRVKSVYELIEAENAELARNAQRMRKSEGGVHGGHRARMRASAKGDKILGGFSDVELLEFLLAFFIPHKDTNVTAHALIDKFGSVLGTLRATADQIAAVPSVTAYAASIIPLMKAVLVCDVPTGVAIKGPFDAADYFGSMCLHGVREGTYVAYLDSKFRLISIERIFAADILPTRTVIGSACEHKAKYVLPVRREPNMFPDAFDLSNKVKTLSDGLMTLSKRLLDFMLFTDYGYYTLGEPQKGEEWYAQYIFVPSLRYSRASALAKTFSQFDYAGRERAENRPDILSELSEFADSSRADDVNKT
ncbi:MAG: hypothetical protein J1G01_00860 [Clostridiales bacterium]|nr:hypothetical protein [Clostridiales bacterium]